MTTFIVLYHASTGAESQPSASSPEDVQAGMDAWTTWAANAGDALVDLGMPLKSTAVHGEGATPSATIAGYSILQAESLDALNALLYGHPHLSVPGATLEVLEGMPMLGAEIAEADVSPVEVDLDEDEDDQDDDGDEDDDDAVADAEGAEAEHAEADDAEEGVAEEVVAAEIDAPAEAVAAE